LNTTSGLSKALLQRVQKEQQRLTADLSAPRHRVLGLDQRDVKIWELIIKKYGRIEMTFKKPQELSAAYEGLSDIEINLLKHRMFAESANGIIGKPEVRLGVLFSVNFMPGNVEIPLEVRWISPANKIYHSQSINVKYLQNQVVSLALPKNSAEIYGDWRVEFFFAGNKIGGQELEVMSAEQYEANLAAGKPKG